MKNKEEKEKRIKFLAERIRKDSKELAKLLSQPGGPGQPRGYG